MLLRKHCNSPSGLTWWRCCRLVAGRCFCQILSFPILFSLGLPGKFRDRNPIRPWSFSPKCFLMTNPVRSGKLLQLSPTLPGPWPIPFYFTAMGVLYMSTCFTKHKSTLYILCFSKCGLRITKGTKVFATAFENHCLDTEITLNLIAQCG
jgi:hypothetical protein